MSSSVLAVRVVVLVPALAAAVGLLLAGRGRTGARAVAVAASSVTLAAALLELFAGGSRPGLVGTVAALPAGELVVPLQLQTGGPVALTAAAVALVSWAVQVFSVHYLEHDDRYGVFAATVSLFSAGMLLVVHSADLLLTLVGWEVMGWCSYLLIGHWSRKESARRAALKAFLVTRFADVGFVLGVVLLAGGAGSTAYRVVLQHWQGDGHGPVRALALCLLVVGVLGKSAQLPFHDWLPDAMEGPTPASALIHAATMVAAGTFVLAQLFPVLVLAGPARWLLAVSAAVTMVGAGVLAFGQSDLKRLLAYSTVSQVAVMLSPLAAAAPAVGASTADLHLYAHALFKALLFLTIGWLSVLAGGTSARLLRGSAAGQQVLLVGWVVGLVALAGLPVTVGGISKEAVVAAAEAGALDGEGRALLVWVALLLSAVVTAAYSTRAVLLVARPDPGSPEPEARPPVPRAVVAVIAVLVVLTVLGGLATLLGVPGPTPGISVATLLLSLALIALGVAGAVLAGAVLAGGLRTGGLRAGGLRTDPAERLIGGRMAWFDNGLGVDIGYRALVARPVLALARLVAAIDTDVVDAYVRGSAAAARLAGSLGRRAHSHERSATGLVWVLLGAVAAAAAGVLLWS